DGRCRHLTEKQCQEYEEQGRRPVIRFLADREGTIVVDDLVRGKVTFDNAKAVDDFVIVRSDGLPTYNFAAVVDDHLMEMTHVLRGDDHLSNTPKQIQIYQALGWEPPRYAHVPMILGSDRSRLSKRHGAVSVGQYRADG